MMKHGKQSSFSDSVYEFTSMVPEGKVTTYGALAKAMGNPRAVRATGNALRANPSAPFVPCHRVVRSDGTVGGYGGQPSSRKKQRMLAKEGVVVVGGKIDLGRFLFTEFD